MLLTSISLKNFRNFEEREFQIGPRLTIIIGENSRGKTNLLEAAYLSVHGIGFRESKEDELVTWHKDDALIESIWDDKGQQLLFGVHMRKRNEVVEKQYFINKTRKPHVTYRQYQTKTVLFAPDHIDIVTGAPDKRREYFNKLLSLYDPEYKKMLNNYERALYKRNKIFEFYSNENSLKEELLFWDGYLEKQATYITNKREEYITYLNKHATIESKEFRIEYLKNELTQDLLSKAFPEERRLRRTTIGPQKDDFHIFLTTGTEKNIHLFGSRSEQRLGVFWLKLNEIQYLQDIFKIDPLLLLDDVFSELDTKNKKLVLDLIDKYQTILTTTEQELLELAHTEKIIISL